MAKIEAKYRAGKVPAKHADESLTRDEERAIEKGRLAYSCGEWKNWADVKHELESSASPSRRKKS
ncbi:MAG: hypothetical protein HYS44_01565 [Candidatus Niyogibacteria bacterium]|nr:hypothetical protein [Candidatus Niyogibacteria bacterium]